MHSHLKSKLRLHTALNWNHFFLLVDQHDVTERAQLESGLGWALLLYGVPQGSILGPNVFSPSRIISERYIISFHFCADDYQIYLLHKRNDGNWLKCKKLRPNLLWQSDWGCDTLTQLLQQLDLRVKMDFDQTLDNQIHSVVKSGFYLLRLPRSSPHL